MKAFTFILVLSIIPLKLTFSAFEEKPSSARNLSLGGATTSLSSEASHLFSNPASLGLLTKREIQLSWSQLFGLEELSSGDFYLSFPLNKRCNRNIIMSCFSKVEMSYLEIAIVSFSKGGYYGREGHNKDEPGGAKEDKCDSPGN